MADRSYFAEFQFTVNTHVRAQSEAHYHRMRAVLLRVIRERFSTRNVIRAIFAIPEGDGNYHMLDLVRAERFPAGVEVARRTRQIHAHFNLLIEAKEPIRLNELNKRAQRFFSTALRIPGVYVHVDLVHGQSIAKALNYDARKEGQQRGERRTIHFEDTRREYHDEYTHGPSSS